MSDIVARIRKNVRHLRRSLTNAPTSASTTQDTPFEPRPLLTELFLRLRRSGFNLGVPELVAVLDAIESGWGRDDLVELAAVARLTWCKSRQDEDEFNEYWQAILPAYGPKPTQERPARPLPVQRNENESLESQDLPLRSCLPQVESPLPQTPHISALPVRIPYLPVTIEGDITLQTHWPLSRRSMIYFWRYLRRPIPDGPADMLDVTATVNRAALQGFYLAPVYRRRERNHAHLVMLVDQGGSMTPLHRFTRDMIESAQHESNLEIVETYYFHNVPGDSYYLDPLMNERVSVSDVLDTWDDNTSVLIISDAGAARGLLSMQRIQTTARFLASIKPHTALIAWLNPMPQTRWEDSSAQFIAGLVPMYPMDPDGMNNAINRLRGQSL